MIDHIAFIMDGNRRWATSKGLLRLKGHREGINTVEKVALFCLEKGINYLSLYTFSVENLKRSEQEKEYLFNMVIEESDRLLQKFIKNKIKAKFIGDRTLFPAKVLPVFERVEKETAEFDRLHVNFLFCYGARQEIVNGVKKIAKKVKNGSISEQQIDDAMLQDHLWSAGFPEPDLIVRTGGQVRLSNFLLYQAAYSEFCFLDCMWPDLDNVHLEEILSNYKKRKRNFGV